MNTLNEIEADILISISDVEKNTDEREIVKIICENKKFSTNELLSAYKGLKEKGYLTTDSKLTDLAVILLDFVNKK